MKPPVTKVRRFNNKLWKPKQAAKFLLKTTPHTMRPYLTKLEKLHGNLGFKKDYNMKLYNIQRPIRKSTLDSMMREAASGSITNIGSAPVVVCTYGSDSVLVNGQTRLLACALTNVPIVIDLESHIVNDPKDIEVIYSYMDQNNPRTAVDATRATHIDEEVGITKAFAGKLCSAIPFMEHDFRKHKKLLSAYDRANKVREYKKEVRMLVSILSDLSDDQRRRVMRRASFLAVAIFLLRHAPLGKASEFLSGCSSGLMLSADDPRKALYDYFSSTTLAGGHPTILHSGGKHFTTGEYDSRTILFAWNAWTLGQNVRQIGKVFLNRAMRGFKINLTGKVVGPMRSMIEIEENEYRESLKQKKNSKQDSLKAHDLNDDDDDLNDEDGDDNDQWNNQKRDGMRGGIMR